MVFSDSDEAIVEACVVEKHGMLTEQSENFLERTGECKRSVYCLVEKILARLRVN